MEIQPANLSQGGTPSVANSTTHNSKRKRSKTKGHTASQSESMRRLPAANTLVADAPPQQPPAQTQSKRTTNQQMEIQPTNLIQGGTPQQPTPQSSRRPFSSQKHVLTKSQGKHRTKRNTASQFESRTHTLSSQHPSQGCTTQQPTAQSNKTHGKRSNA